MAVYNNINKKHFFFILYATNASLVSLPSHIQIVSGFQGPYPPATWTLPTPGPGGSVDTTAAPNSITFIGPDGPAFIGYDSNTDYTTAALDSGLVTFEWNYSSTDSGT
jgi:hypothetical protein